jgi:hypothetical protein
LALSAADLYSRNLSALRAVQPTVADVVDTVRIPDDVEEAVGRDRSRTFLLSDGAGRRVWFGQSSMPAVSAVEMFCNVRGDGGNVSQPGILTGCEPPVIAERLPKHGAVFVLEENPLHLRLAMYLHDYSALLTSGRLVFVVGDDLAARLVEFFEGRPGYLLPTQMFTVPQRSPAQIADLQRRLEQAGEAVLGVQARVVESCTEALRRRTLGRLPEAPRVALLSVDATPVALEHAGRIERALARLGWPHEVCVPNAPDKCHVAARMQAIERSCADLVLFVNGPPGMMRPLLPAEMPVAAWYLPDARVPTTPSSHLGLHDVFWVSSKAQHEAILAAGLPASALARCEPAADVATFHPIAVQDHERTPIAILMDLPDDRPEASGVTLPSHVALWEALQNATLQRADRYSDDLADEILEAAQRSCGTTLDESASREQFVAFLRTRIAPATVARAAVQALATHGGEFAIWGSNWPAAGDGNDRRRGPMPSGERLNQTLNATGGVILPWMSTTAVQLALDALAAGANVILRSTQESLLSEHPGLSSVAGFLSFYRTGRELTDTVRRMRSLGKTRQERAEAAVAEIQANHSVTNRLIAIVDRLRERQE